MRILHIIRSVNPAGGGPIEGVRQLGALANDSGNQVEVASLDPPDAAFLKGFPLQVHPLGPGRGTYGYSPRMVPWLRDNIGQFDIAVVNGIWQYHSLATWRALRNASTPYVVFTHGMLDPWFKRRYPLKHLKKWMYWPWAEYRVLRRASAVLFTCEEERILARRSFWLYDVKERVVTYGTARPPAATERQREEFFARFPETRGKRLLLFMGRLHPKKGCDLAVEAFATELAPDPDWHLVMAGPDQVGWQAKLEQTAARLEVANRITWTGMLGGDLKWGAVKSAEAFYLPSHQENFGIVVAEALACGVPALISDRVNIWREVKGDGGGMVAGDDLRGARALLRGWADKSPNEKERMREAARLCFESRFEIHTASRDLLATLQNVAGTHAAERMRGAA